MNNDLSARLNEARSRTNATLKRWLSENTDDGEIERPERLLAAMRHAALAPGKRLRPFLVIETARLFGVDDAAVGDTAAALECVHCYSLIHDDLPAMDDDDLRRGLPTVHKAYDEATAILAGDAMLTLAFARLADHGRNGDPALGLALVARLATAAGCGGMVGGQVFDLAAENQTVAEADIRTLQAMKTGALFRFACEAGALHGRADQDGVERLSRFGAQLGLAFQLADDLLDATGTTEEAGKLTAKDAERGKATLVALHGVQKARALLAEAIDDANAELTPFGDRAGTLNGLARSLAR